MTPVTPTTYSFSSARNARGQTIVVALLVLLLLGLVGAVFITVVARNLVNARHANRVLTADNYARAGVAFADSQLTYSPGGADWRPPLQFALLNPPTEAREMARYNANTLAAPATNDPDARYLEQGYARYNTGAGRFLLRLTYTPVLFKDASGNFYDPVIGATGTGNTTQANVPIALPPGRYIKIESIGREGVIDPTDPTTYTNNRSTDRTQAVQVAYKPIGITDYARFETNPDKRSDIANLGVISQFYTGDTDGEIATPGAYDFVQDTTANPVKVKTDANGFPVYQIFPVVTTYGSPTTFVKDSVTGTVLPNVGQPVPAGHTYTTLAGGGSIHANMPVRFFGKNQMYLHDPTLYDTSGNVIGSDTPLYQDVSEVAGDLLLDTYDPNVSLDNAKYTAPTGGPNSRPAGEGQRASLVLNPPATGAPPPTAYASPSNDTGSNGGFATFGGLLRDGSLQNDVKGQPRGITRLEPPLMDTVDPATSLPRYKALAMMSPPRVNPTASPAANYVPGAAQYGYGKYLYIDNTTDIQPDSTAILGGTSLTDEWLHQTSSGLSADPSKGNWSGHFYEPPGVTIVLGRVVNATSTANPPAAVYGIHMERGDSVWKNPDGTAGTTRTMDVSYADMDAENDPTTSGGNLAANADNNMIIYAEGNVRLRGTLSPSEMVNGTSKTLPRHITIVTGGTAYIDGNLIQNDPDSSITVLAHDYVCVNTTQFLAGPLVQKPPVSKTDATKLEIDDANPLTQEYTPGGSEIYVSAASTGGDALADFNFYLSTNPLTNLGQDTYTFSELTPTHVTFAVPASAGGSDTFQVARDPGTNPNLAVTTGNVLLDRVAILPMNITVQAVLYAQTRSFFVIPGDWFNTESSDTLNIFAPTVTAANPNGMRPFGDNQANNWRFPFYGQPIDLKITIDGSVSEARPADIAAQSAWMLKWGWIPQYHGSLFSESAGHPSVNQMPAQGLQIVYNPLAGYPYNSVSDPTANPPVTAHYLRSDLYGRPLPFSPNLPVSTGLIYSGETSEPPLLQ